MFIVNKSFTTGKFPCSWNEEKVNPLFKSGAKDDINNYRPISFLLTLSKVIAKRGDTQLFRYVNNFYLLHNSQSEFRPKRYTECALILMIDYWLKAIKDGKIVGGALIDFRKAFNLSDHKILLNKLKYYKFNDTNDLYPKKPSVFQ